ncbi:MAG: nucleoside triphosphate pyrophosphohydrolase [Bauldia sp.]|nr:nucleoside triphosphate pyrophosphohydrolase [Bauldia sp.]
MKPSRDIARLIEIMAALRDPVTGCPWDLEQSFASIAPYTIEEAYEVADAIERDDMAALRDELGDLLFQSVYHARLAEEAGAFAFGDVVEAITAKMIRRHPHVFGDAVATRGFWERAKAAERQDKATATGEVPGLLDDVPVALPGLARAVKLQKRAATVGFDWSEPETVLAKVREETNEIAVEIAHNSADTDRIEDEIGDLLFAVANLARHLKVDPDAALRRTNAKFERRFRHIERRLSERGIPMAEAGLDVMEALWVEAKDTERNAGAE